MISFLNNCLLCSKATYIFEKWIIFFNCFVCKREFDTVDNIITHLKYSHLLRSGSILRCSQSNCISVFNHFPSFKQHLLNMHKTCKNFEASNSKNDILDTNYNGECAKNITEENTVQEIHEENNITSLEGMCQNLPVVQNIESKICMNPINVENIVRDLNHSSLKFLSKFSAECNVTDTIINKLFIFYF